MKKESFKNNLICWLFGHALPIPPPLNFHQIPKEGRHNLIVRCERCDTNQPLISFKAYKRINNY